MWKQVIAEKVQDDKKNDIQDLKQRTEQIEEKMKDLERKFMENTKEIEQKIKGLEKKMIDVMKKRADETEKVLKDKADETDKKVEDLEQKLSVAFGDQLKKRTARLEGLIADRDVDMAVIMKHYEERTEAETKKDKKVKKIEQNVNEILNLLR